MRMRHIGVFFAVFVALLFEAALVGAAETVPKTDEERTKKVEEMFKSPYTEEMYYRTDRLLLTATGSLLPIHKAPSVASIITSEDIEKLGATTVDEALETVPGLHVIPSVLAYLDPTYSIRGIYTSVNPQVLFLIDGQPFTMPFTGSRPAGFRMPVADISRIEVIRGPGSAVHGADAFAGVINIITKDGFEIKGPQAGVRAGSFGTNDYWLQEGGDWSGWNVAFSMEYLTSNGDDDRIIESDGQTILDSIYNTSASLAPGPLKTGYNILDTHLHLAKNNWVIKLWSWTTNDADLGAGATQTLANKSSGNNKQYLIDLMYKNANLIDDLDNNIRLAYLYRHEDGILELFPDNTVLPIGGDGNITAPSLGTRVKFPDGLLGSPQKTDEQMSIDFTSNYAGINSHQLRIGTGFKYIEEKTKEYKNFGPGVINGSTIFDDISVNGTLTDVSNTPYVFMENQNRKLIYISFQDEWSFAKSWELTGGVRYDHYSDFGDTVNPRAALVWETRYDLTTKLLYGRAFRAPSFMELFNKNNPVNLGNPNLGPEKIQTYEVAFDYQPTLRLRNFLNLFYYKVNDLIEFVPDPSGVSKTAQNAKNQTGYGFEFETKWETTDQLTLNANCAYQRSKNKVTDEISPYAPELQFYAGADWNFFPHWSLDTQVYWIGERHRAAGDTRPDIKDYTLTNLTLRRNKIMKHWDLALIIKNIFNADAREPSSVSPPSPAPIPNDYPMEGRGIYAELKFHY